MVGITNYTTVIENLHKTITENYELKRFHVVIQKPSATLQSRGFWLKLFSFTTVTTYVSITFPTGIFIFTSSMSSRCHSMTETYIPPFLSASSLSLPSEEAYDFSWVSRVATNGLSMKYGLFVLGLVGDCIGASSTSFPPPSSRTVIRCVVTWILVAVCVTFFKKLCRVTMKSIEFETPKFQGRWAKWVRLICPTINKLTTRSKADSRKQK